MFTGNCLILVFVHSFPPWLDSEFPLWGCSLNFEDLMLPPVRSSAQHNPPKVFVFAYVEVCSTLDCCDHSSSRLNCVRAFRWGCLISFPGQILSIGNQSIYYRRWSRLRRPAFQRKHELEVVAGTSA